MAIYDGLDELVIHVVAGRNGTVVTQERNKAICMHHMNKTLPGGRLWGLLPSLVDGPHTSVPTTEPRVGLGLKQSLFLAGFLGNAATEPAVVPAVQQNSRR